MVTEVSQGLITRKRLRAMRLIQDAALGIAETRGYEAATMEAIAGAADVSTRSAYRYFGRKEAVFLWDDADASVLDALGDLAIPAPEAIRVAVKALYGRRLERDADGYRRRLALIFAVPQLRVEMLRQIDGFRAALQERLMARDEGLTELETEVVSRAAVGALIAAISAWAGAGGTRAFVDVVDAAFAAVPANFTPRGDHR